MPPRRKEDRTGSNVGHEDHEPSAQMPADEPKRKTPGIEEHDAGGQGLSG